VFFPAALLYHELLLRAFDRQSTFFTGTLVLVVLFALGAGLFWSLLINLFRHRQAATIVSIAATALWTVLVCVEYCCRSYFKSYFALSFIGNMASDVVGGFGDTVLPDVVLPRLPVRVLGAAVGGILAGPVLAGMYDTVLRALRDEAGYWWTTYRKAFKQNFKASILPGMLYCIVVTVQIFLVYFCFNLLYHGTNVGVGMWVATVLNLVIFHMLFSYMWPQVVLLDQPFGQTLKNSVNCMIAFLPHALAASLVTVLFWGLVILCMPLGLLLMLVFGFWFQVEITSQIVYGDLDRVFHIEENIRKLHDAEYEAEMAEERSDDEE